MRKTAYKNEESRQRRAVTGATKNTHFDATTFKSVTEVEDEASRLGLKKRELETQLSVANSSLQRAKAQAFHNKNYMPPKAWKALQDKQALLKREILEIDKEIQAAKSIIRSQAREKHEEKVGTFDYTFRMMAKQLLAGPVYERILTASIHQLSEEQNKNET